VADKSTLRAVLSQAMLKVNSIRFSKTVYQETTGSPIIRANAMSSFKIQRVNFELCSDGAKSLLSRQKQAKPKFRRWMVLTGDSHCRRCCQYVVPSLFRACRAGKRCSWLSLAASPTPLGYEYSGNIAWVTRGVFGWQEAFIRIMQRNEQLPCLPKSYLCTSRSISTPQPWRLSRRIGLAPLSSPQ
jgi:hypothetical protein